MRRSVGRHVSSCGHALSFGSRAFVANEAHFLRATRRRRAKRTPHALSDARVPRARFAHTPSNAGRCGRSQSKSHTDRTRTRRAKLSPRRERRPNEKIRGGRPVSVFAVGSKDLEGERMARRAKKTGVSEKHSPRAVRIAHTSVLCTRANTNTQTFTSAFAIFRTACDIVDE